MVLYLMCISQTHAFQKLGESRRGYCITQDYSVNQVTSKIACNDLSEHLSKIAIIKTYVIDT